MNRKTKKLLKQLEHDDPKTRYIAVLELGRMGDTALLDPLDRVANLDEDHRVRDLAAKATRTLEILKRREDSAARAAEIAVLDAAEGGSDYEWKSMASDQMMDQTSRAREADQFEEWNYQKAKEGERLSKEEHQQRLREAQEARERLAKREAIRKRRPFRIVLYIATAIVVVLTALILYVQFAVEQPPETRAEVLSELSEWSAEQAAAAAEFQTAIESDPADCATLNGLAVPQRPFWTGQLDNTEERTQAASSSFLDSLSEQMSALDMSLVVGLEPVVNNLNRAESRLLQLKDAFAVACADQTVLSRADLNTSLTAQGAGGYLLQAQNSIVGANSILVDQQLPADRIEVLVSLQEWLAAQQGVAQVYRIGLGTETLDCAALKTVEVPPAPVWLAQRDSVNPAFVANLDVPIDTQQQIDGELIMLKTAVDGACGDNATLQRSAFAEFATVSGIPDEVDLFASSVTTVLDQEINAIIGG